MKPDKSNVSYREIVKKNPLSRSKIVLLRLQGIYSVLQKTVRDIYQQLRSSGLMVCLMFTLLPLLMLVRKLYLFLDRYRSYV